jgi:hypothetical protein
MAVALGVPVGFAVEILSFLGLSALNLRGLMPLLPLVWLGIGVGLWRQRRTGPLRARLGRRHATLTLALAGLFLATVVAAVCQMFAESPLVDGLPQRPIFHDWVYLASRAAAIKHHWPLEDPSLAGSSLQYHYFMLVHAASASWLVKLEVTMVLLRLMIVPLGAVLVVQAFVLGRMVSRNAWGGVLAAALTTVVSEASLATDYGRPMFLGMFVRWLYFLFRHDLLWRAADCGGEGHHGALVVVATGGDARAARGGGHRGERNGPAGLAAGTGPPGRMVVVVAAKIPGATSWHRLGDGWRVCRGLLPDDVAMGLGRRGAPAVEGISCHPILAAIR